MAEVSSGMAIFVDIRERLVEDPTILATINQSPTLVRQLLALDAAVANNTALPIALAADPNQAFYTPGDLPQISIGTGYFQSASRLRTG